MPHSGFGQHPSPVPGNSLVGNGTNVPPSAAAKSIEPLITVVGPSMAGTSASCRTLTSSRKLVRISSRSVHGFLRLILRLPPGSAEVIHPRHVSRGDVRTKYKISLLPGDQLECQEVGGADLNGLNLKILMVRLPKEGDATLPRTHCL